MAKPAGAITPGDGGLAALADPYFSFAYFCFRLPFQPQHWHGDGDDKRHSCIVARQYTVSNGADLTDNYKFTADILPVGLADVTVTGDGTAAFDGAWAERTQSPDLHGNNPGCPPLSDIDTLPLYSMGRVKFWKDAGTVELLGVYVEHTSEDAYTDPDGDERSVEIMGRTGANRIHDADEPISAWHAQWVLCHSMNKCEYEAGQVWSVPI